MSTKQKNARLAVLAMGGKASPAALAATEAYTFVIAKIKQKNGLNFKLIDAVDIDWADFDWASVNLPTYTLPIATDKALGGVKIGANISKADDGTISVTADNVKAALGFTPADSALFPEGKVNADTLAGKAATDYALKTDVNNALNGLDWKNNVADAAALKAIAKPTEGMTVSLADTNAIYRFDAQNTATADADDASVLVATDKTAGAWLRIGSTVYSPATAQADGLMSKNDKAKLDAFATADQYAKKTDIKTYTAGNNIQISDTNEIGVTPGVYAPAADLANKVDKVDGKGLSTNDFTNDYKTKLDSLGKIAAIVFAGIDVGSNATVNIADLNVPDGYTIGLSTKVIDNQGGQYDVTKINDDGETVVVGPVGLQLALKNAVDGKVDKVAGKGLSTNDYDNTAKTKVDGLANIKTVGDGLALDEDGNLTATAQTPDLSAYQTTAQADAKYATKADVEIVSEDFIKSLFASA